ncbi:MAG TPA: STAS domain-containing protein [Thermoanaerobaculia bacterium]|nr:STAS domain-containing protein [Thermoanaerobaculia bacterium]
MANPFSVTRSTEQNLTILALVGFLDAHTAPEFENAIQQELDADNIRLIVDCSKLTYISSAGLGVFMGFIEELRERGGDIKICALSPKVEQVFEILGFPALYDILADVPATVQRFADSPIKQV